MSVLTVFPWTVMKIEFPAHLDLQDKSHKQPSPKYTQLNNVFTLYIFFHKIADLKYFFVFILYKYFVYVTHFVFHLEQK